MRRPDWSNRVPMGWSTRGDEEREHLGWMRNLGRRMETLHDGEAESESDMGDEEEDDDESDDGYEDDSDDDDTFDSSEERRRESDEEDESSDFDTDSNLSASVGSDVRSGISEGGDNGTDGCDTPSPSGFADKKKVNTSRGSRLRMRMQKFPEWQPIFPFILHETRSPSQRAQAALWHRVWRVSAQPYSPIGACHLEDGATWALWVEGRSPLLSLLYCSILLISTALILIFLQKVLSYHMEMVLFSLMP